MVVMPTFTYQCMVWPLAGPPNNAVTYDDHQDDNAYADIFRPDLRAHPSLGRVAETLRRLPGAIRSAHPVMSFAAWGEGAQTVVSAQSRAEPLGPVAHLADASRDGDVLLLGVGHTVNTSIHYAEYRAGRKQFIRWALTPAGVVECVAFPGCSDGSGDCAARSGDQARHEIGDVRPRLPSALPPNRRRDEPTRPHCCATGPAANGATSARRSRRFGASAVEPPVDQSSSCRQDNFLQERRYGQPRRVTLPDPTDPGKAEATIENMLVLRPPTRQQAEDDHGQGPK
jgi:hypothetical protein